MSFLWDSVKQSAEIAGEKAKIAAQKTKLKADCLLIDRKIQARKQKFGVDLYEFVVPLSKSPAFFAADDKMTNILRGPFLSTQREIEALERKRVKCKEAIAQNEVAHAAAFPVEASNFGGKVWNAGKSAGYMSKGAKLKTDLASVETQMKAHKQDFGLTMFSTFVELEDKEGWLPTVRDIRSLYDQARREVEQLMAQKAGKEKEARTLGVGASSTEEASSINGITLPPGNLGEPATGTSTRASMNGFLSPSAPAHAPDPFISSTAAAGTAPGGSNGQFAASPAPPTASDPFASLRSASSAAHDPFTPSPTTAHDPFAPATSATTSTRAPATTDDPFAIFANAGSQPTTSNQDSSRPNDNPMFRY